MTICCSDHNCKYNHDCGYYGICEHPSVINNKVPGYGGITRILRETCKEKEKKNEHN